MVSDSDIARSDDINTRVGWRTQMRCSQPSIRPLASTPRPHAPPLPSLPLSQLSSFLALAPRPGRPAIRRYNKQRSPPSRSSDHRKVNAVNVMAGGKTTKIAPTFSRPPYQLTVQEVADELNTSIEDGLTTQQAAENLAKYGENKLEGEGAISPWRILLKQVANAM